MKHSYRNALVTGASSGLGRGIARELTRHGIPVFLAARRMAALEELRDELVREGHSASVVTLDVADTERTVATLRELDGAHALDLVIANAGVGADHDAAAPYAWEAMRDALHTNFCGAAATLTAVLPEMVARGRGHLVGIGSLASFGPLPLSAAYCSPKAGLHMLLECLRLDTAGTGITVTNVQVGFVKTPMLERVTHPTPGLLSVEEASETIVRALFERREDVVFPGALALAARAAGKLPRFVQKAVARTASRTIRKTIR
jgi:short-subunit dehydrogenase